MSPGMLASADRTLVETSRSGCLVDDQASREAHPQMLVLTRKSNQSIMIGDDIEVSVLAIMGEKVRIGIQAPRDIPVFRKEVYLEIQQERLGSGKGVREEVDAALRGLGEGT
jgi:carbon storage regulator